MHYITPNHNQCKQIVKNLNDYNLKQVSPSHANWTSLSQILLSDDDTLVGGINAGVGYWGGLEIQHLWIHDDFRGQGYASQLLEMVELAAKKMDAIMSMVDTFDFQAVAFYQKHGYQSAGEIPNFPRGHKRVYLYKVL